MARLLCLPHPLHLIHILHIESPTLLGLVPRIAFTLTVPVSRATHIKTKDKSSDCGILSQMGSAVEAHEKVHLGKVGEDLPADGRRQAHLARRDLLGSNWRKFGGTVLGLHQGDRQDRLAARASRESQCTIHLLTR